MQQISRVRLQEKNPSQKRATTVPIVVRRKPLPKFCPSMNCSNASLFLVFSYTRISARNPQRIPRKSKRVRCFTTSGRRLDGCLLQCQETDADREFRVLSNRRCTNFSPFGGAGGGRGAAPAAAPAAAGEEAS